MGYSVPKKQLDLREFLSKPATKRPGSNGFGFRKFPTVKAKPVEDTREEQEDNEG
ncbi:hypothetical protein [Seohaeicola zhoushanensis]|uniref:Uncharacterized protein n=1 Tax=Seohaeicola zhoushanensis TaxID=1569283 RepID=A0A8J3MAC2_9RHOB|nr:hypothetical protein [Seohaeicola zhoushanensis]GHF66359.1 hypothetical protein GCM10017056_41930 [Seohaeicola zhoushanensis]